ncbi:MAG: FISUMP domain-containing protein [Candidatus Anammoxibacter sp.]
MVRRYLLTGLCIIFLGTAGIVNAADTKVTAEDDTDASGFSVENASGVERFSVSAAGGFLIPRLTTAERDALTAVNGMMIYNTTTGEFEGFKGGAWVALSGAAAPSFTCGVDQVQDADGNLYDTVKIGGQCWMAENLNVGNRIDGVGNQTNNSTTEKYCYDNIEANCASDGGLYQWDEMMQYTNIGGSQGVCPIGWHLPTDSEWKTLEMNLGMTQAEADTDFAWRGTDQGTQLKVGGTSGFQALLAGFRVTDGSFSNRGTGAIFWSSTESGSGAWYRKLVSSEARVVRIAVSKALGLSVRCVKD